jgi:hypothetical protein
MPAPRSFKMKNATKMLTPAQKLVAEKPVPVKAASPQAVPSKVELKPAEIEELRQLDANAARIRIELANATIAQAQALGRCAQIDQKFQDRVAAVAAAHGIDLSGTAGRWSFDLSTGLFTRMQDPAPLAAS